MFDENLYDFSPPLYFVTYRFRSFYTVSAHSFLSQSLFPCPNNKRNFLHVFYCQTAAAALKLVSRARTTQLTDLTGWNLVTTARWCCWQCWITSDSDNQDWPLRSEVRLVCVCACAWNGKGFSLCRKMMMVFLGTGHGGEMLEHLGGLDWENLQERK